EGQRTPAGEDELRSRALPRPVVQKIMKPHRTLEPMKPASAAILAYCARLAQHLDGRDCAPSRLRPGPGVPARGPKTGRRRSPAWSAARPAPCGQARNDAPLRTKTYADGQITHNADSGRLD